MVFSLNRAWLPWRFFLPKNIFTVACFLTLHISPHDYFHQFHVDPCLTISVCYYINSICVECMPHRLRVQSLAHSIFQIDKINSRFKRKKKRSTVNQNMYKSFERLKYESESLVSLSATQPKYWRFSVYSLSSLIPLAVWACNWMNIWLWLLNNEGSLQGAAQGNRYNLNVIKSAEQKEAYQWWGWK